MDRSLSSHEYGRKSLKRTWFQFGALIAVLSLLISCTGQSGAPSASGSAQAKQSGAAKELVVASWGDPYLAGWKKQLIPSFEQKFNVKITWLPSGGSQATLTNAIAHKGEVDVALLDDGGFAGGVKQDIWEPLDFSRINTSDLYDVALTYKSSGGVAIGVGVTGGYYNTKVFQEKGWTPPTSIKDLADPKYCNHVTIHTITNGIGLGVLQIMALANGGDATNFDPGFAPMTKLAPCVLTFDTFGDTSTLIQQGAGWVGSWDLGRVKQLRDVGAPVDFIRWKEGVSGYVVMAPIVKGAPHKELAYEFINYLLTADQQKNTAMDVGFGPLNKTVRLTPDQTQYLVYGEDQVKQVKLLDWTYVNKNRDAWTEKWKRQVEGQR